MYPDHSLMPKETVRLAALGMLAEKSRAYADLASAVRDFTGHVVGPNLDLMGVSIQLLCTEGLAEPESDAAGDGAAHRRAIPADAVLTITGAGRAELRNLLLAAVRSPFNDLNKLVVALKMRFIGLLDAAQRASQIQIICAALEGELARLGALRAARADEAGADDALVSWLDHDLAQLEDSLAWFRALDPSA